MTDESPAPPAEAPAPAPPSAPAATPPTVWVVDFAAGAVLALPVGEAEALVSAGGGRPATPVDLAVAGLAPAPDTL